MELFSEDFIEHSNLLCSSYRKVTGQNLVNNELGVNIEEALYEAPFVVVSHGVQLDPIFSYANLTAQSLWGYSWGNFITLPSRLSAEPSTQQEREVLLKKVLLCGYIDDYEGVRITNSGHKFRIKNVFIWNIMDQNRQYHGQAAMFKSWQHL